MNLSFYLCYIYLIFSLFFHGKNTRPHGSPCTMSMQDWMLEHLYFLYREKGRGRGRPLYWQMHTWEREREESKNERINERGDLE